MESLLEIIEKFQDLTLQLIARNQTFYTDFTGIMQKINELMETIQIASQFQNDEDKVVLMRKFLNYLIKSLQLRLRRIHESLQQISDEIFEKHIQDITEHAKIPGIPENCDANNFVKSPQVEGFDAIYGLEHVKKQLIASFLLKKTQPQLFRFKNETMNTVLLFGPPGTGKTMIAQAFSHELSATFCSISSSALISPMVGETEKNIKQLFDFSKANEGFTVIFIDELDGFCRKRTYSEQDYSRRLKTEIMCQLSSLEGCENVVVISATNCPWDIDSAIMRRFSKRIFINLPNREERFELINNFLSANLNLDTTNDKFEELLSLTEGFSSSDLKNLVQNALDLPIIELQSTKFWKRSYDNFYVPAKIEDCGAIQMNLLDLPNNSVKSRPVSMADLISEAKKFKVTVTRADMLKYEEFVTN